MKSPESRAFSVFHKKNQVFFHFSTIDCETALLPTYVMTLEGFLNTFQNLISKNFIFSKQN